MSSKYTFFALLFFNPVAVFAQEYSTLIDSGLSNTEGLSEYINNIYLLLISAAAMFAVIKIIIAGVKYMLSDVVTSKEDAKKDIRTSLLGLIIIVSAVLILRTINPNLTDFNLRFEKPDPVNSINLLANDSMNLLTDTVESLEVPECATKESSQEGRYGTVTLNVSDCDEESRTLALEELTKVCGELNSTVKKSSGDESIYSCLSELAAERWPINKFPGAEIDDWNLANIDPKIKLLEEYMEWQGNVVTYNAEAHCGSLNLGPTGLDRTMEQCVDAIKDRFIDDDDYSSFGAQNAYCENNGGQAVGGLSCLMPTTYYTYEQAKADWAKGAGLAAVNTGRGDTTGFTLGQYSYQCKEKLGNEAKVVDTQIFGNSSDSDTLCVRY